MYKSEGVKGEIRTSTLLWEIFNVCFGYWVTNEAYLELGADPAEKL